MLYTVDSDMSFGLQAKRVFVLWCRRGVVAV